MRAHDAAESVREWCCAVLYNEELIIGELRTVMKKEKLSEYVIFIVN